MAKIKKINPSTKLRVDAEQRRSIKKSTPIVSTIKGLDIGTAFIYSAQRSGPEVVFKKERNAFLI